MHFIAPPPARHRRGQFQAFCLVLALTGLVTSRPAAAAPASWAVDADGLWITPTNWSTNPALPGPADDVAISVPGDRLITLSGGGTQVINTLVSDERLTIGGTNTALQIGTTLKLNNTLTLTEGATLRGPSVTTTDGGSIVFASGVLDGVSMGTGTSLDLQTINGATMVAYNGLTLNGTMNLG